jgi:site-specific recombinase XerD
MVNEKGIPMPMVQAMMGHSRIDTTGIYAKANPKEAVKRAWESF